MAIGGRGGVLNEVLTNISLFWGVFRLKPLIILAFKWLPKKRALLKITTLIILSF